jgi:hypothetical protein
MSHFTSGLHFFPPSAMLEIHETAWSQVFSATVARHHDEDA